MAKSIYQIIIDLEGDQKTQQALTQLGTTIGLTGAALTAFSAGAGKLAADYESALANVKTVSDETTGSTQEFSDAMFQLQSDMKGAINVQAGMTASYDILSAGIKDQEAVMQALESSQKAAIAGQSDLNSVSSAAVSVVNSYGDALGEGLTQAEQFDKVVNLMLQTQLDGVITADQYASSIGSIAAGMKVAGLSIEEVNAVIAVTTSKGIPAASAFTNLEQAVSNIQKPSKMAADEAKRMGIEFNAARLQTVGLDGIIRDMVESGEMQADTLSKMFESTQARNSIAVLVDNLDDLDDKIQSQVNGMGALDQAYADTSETINQRVTNSINLLEGALTQAGQGVIIAAEPIIKLVAQLVEMLSQLDPKVLQVAGAMTAIIGVTLTLNGAVILLVAQYGSLVKTAGILTTFLTGKMIPALTGSKLATLAYAAANKKLTFSGIVSGLAAKAAGLKSVTLAMGTAKVAMAGAAKGMAAFAVAAGPMIIALGSIPILLGKLKEQRANAEIEELNTQLAIANGQTQPLADKVSQLVFQMRETGEAMPDEEFDKWVDLLEQADEGNGTLTSTIEAFKRVQEEAKGSTEDLSEATEESTQSVEDAAEAYDEYAKKVTDSIARIDKQRANSLAAVEGSESEQIQKRLKINEDFTRQQIALLEDLKKQSGTSADERLNIEIEIQSKMHQVAKDRTEANKQLEELHTQYLRDAHSQRSAQLEAYKLRTGATIKETYEQEKGLIDELYELEKGFIQAKINGAAKGSAERQKYVTQLAEHEVSYLRESQSLNEQHQAAIQKAALETIQAQIDKQKDYLDLLDMANEVQSAYISNANANLETQSNLLGRVSDALNDQNFSLEHRKQLLEFASEITGQTVDIENAQGVVQNQIANIEQRKLELKVKQLEIERQQLAVQSQIKQLDIQGQRQEIQSQLSSGNLSEQERQNLNQRDQTLGQRADLERQMAQLADQGLADAIQGSQLEARLNEIVNSGRQAGRSGAPTVGGLQERASDAGLKNFELSGLRDRGLLTSEEYDKIAKTHYEAATKKQEELDKNRQKDAQAANSKLDEQASNTQSSNNKLDSLGSQGETQSATLSGINNEQKMSTQASNNLLQSTNRIGNNLPVVIDRLTAISSTASVISRQLDFVQRQLNSLPSQIAANMPRPAPPSRN